MRGDSGVAGEGRVVGIPKFHSWGKCTMPLMNINSDWMSNASSGLCIIYIIYIIYAGPLSCILGCNKLCVASCWCTFSELLTATVFETITHCRLPALGIFQ